MTIQPDSVRYTRPGEVDDTPITPTSDYTDATEPNLPCTDHEEATHIVLWHVQQYIAEDTEDEHVRVAALTCDLGVKANRMGFRYLVDIYRDRMPPAYAEHWCRELTEYLKGHGIRKDRP